MTPPPPLVTEFAVRSNDREELAANIGGYEGAGHSGEFAFLQENHTGQSGPRTELAEIMDWLARKRRQQRFLGYPEECCTYMYDIPAWPVRIHTHTVASHLSAKPLAALGRQLQRQ